LLTAVCECVCVGYSRVTATLCGEERCCVCVFDWRNECVEERSERRISFPAIGDDPDYHPS